MNNVFNIPDLLREQARRGERYIEFLRVPALSAGVYVLAAGGTDPQSRHKEDEMYYVIRGRARMKVGNEQQDIGAGRVVFVAAGVEHRFFDIAEELAILVLFAPAESS